jgi:hypothetical protein
MVFINILLGKREDNNEAVFQCRMKDVYMHTALKFTVETHQPFLQGTVSYFSFYTQKQ